MSSRGIEQLLSNYKRFYPDLAEDSISYYSNGFDTVVVLLKDGSRVEYNDRLKSIRYLKEFLGTEEDWKREFSAKLLNVMSFKGYDQTRLSKKSGISQVSISNYIRRRQVPNGYTLRKIADTLGCSVNDLTDF